MQQTTHSGRTALVTGASGGIGRTIAEQFARDGANVVIAARSGAELERLAAEWSGRYAVTVTPLVADLSRSGAAAGLANAVESRGLGIDFLVNNAGYGLYGTFDTTRIDDELGMMRINMEALTVLTKRFLPGIKAKRGRIMNVASTAAFQAGPYMAVYYATKAYVLLFSEAIAEELKGTGVTLTAFCPGPTKSGFQDKAVMQKSGLVANRKLPGAEEVGIEGYRAMMRGTRVYVPGLVNKLLVQSVRFGPRNLNAAVVAWLSKPVAP